MVMKGRKREINTSGYFMIHQLSCHDGDDATVVLSGSEVESVEWW